MAFTLHLSLDSRDNIFHAYCDPTTTEKSWNPSDLCYLNNWLKKQDKEIVLLVKDIFARKKVMKIESKIGNGIHSVDPDQIVQKLQDELKSIFINRIDKLFPEEKPLKPKAEDLRYLENKSITFKRMNRNSCNLCNLL